MTLIDTVVLIEMMKMCGEVHVFELVLQCTTKIRNEVGMTT